MFFPRLRRQAKWVFVFLALVFGVGFVAFGVGSSLPSGFADVFQGQSATGELSVGDAREQVEDNPKDADAQLGLSRALQRDRRTDEAIAPLERYVELKPRDQNGLQELAGLLTSRATTLQEEALAAQAEATRASGLSVFQTDQTLGQILGPAPLDKTLVDDANERFNTAYQGAIDSYTRATATYGKLVKLAPSDADLWYLLALSAEPTGDTKTALRGYRKFLELAPEAAEAAFVRDKIKQLQAQSEKQSADASR